MAGIGLSRILADAAGIRGREVIPKIITVANPAVGADWSQLIPGGVAWLIQSIRATYATSAVVGARFSNLDVSDGTNTFITVTAASSVSASATVPITWLRDYGFAASPSGAARFTNSLWNFPLLGGWTVQAVTVSKDTGDQWSSIIMYVLEIEETPYDVEVARDLSRLAGNRVDAVPQIGSEY